MNRRTERPRLEPESSRPPSPRITKETAPTANQQSLDEAFSLIKEAIKEAEEKSDIADRIVEATRKGWVETPNENTTDRAYFDAVREQVVKVCFAYWNEHRLPLGLRSLVKLVEESIRSQKREGGWAFGVPSELTIRRRANESASKEFAEKSGESTPMLVCLGRTKGMSGVLDSQYLPNPSLFSEDSKREILAVAEAKD